MSKLRFFLLILTVVVLALVVYIFLGSQADSGDVENASFFGTESVSTPSNNAQNANFDSSASSSKSPGLTPGQLAESESASLQLPVATQAQSRQQRQHSTDPQRTQSSRQTGSSQSDAELAQTGMLISGTVLTDAGEAAGDLLLQLRPLRVFSADQVAGTAGPRQTYSEADGGFVFHGLADGDYLIEVAMSDQFSPASARVAAGSTDVKVVVKENSGVMALTGAVSDPTGRPLGSVSIIVGTLRGARGETDANGEYIVQLALAGEQRVAVQYRAEGYETVNQTLQGDALIGAELRLDITLKPKQQTTTITGAVRSSDGTAVAGSRVDIVSSSTNTKLSANTDSMGQFSIDGAVPANDYRLWVRPSTAHQDYNQNNIRIGAVGEHIDVVVQALERGGLVGQMVNQSGAPIADYTVWARTNTSSQTVQITSDESGFFFAEQVPVGRVSVSTNAWPKLSITGIEVASGEETAIELVIDLGELTLIGTVIDAAEQPIAGAQLSLKWQQARDGLNSSMIRRTTTDSSGRFTFSLLDRGPHQLTVQGAPGVAAFNRSYQVGNENDITLQLN